MLIFLEKSHKVKFAQSEQIIQNSLCAIVSRTKWGIINNVVGWFSTSRTKCEMHKVKPHNVRATCTMEMILGSQN